MIQQSRKRTLFIFFISIIGVIFMCGCNDKKPPPEATKLEGFSFFGLDAATLYSDGLRDDLENKLGSNAIDHKTTLNLNMNTRTFLSEYFPHLHELNLRLNGTRGMRIEHDTIKLMFRYTQKKNIPFHYVELIFSNRSKKPLLFRINARKDGDQIIDALKKKYGEPEIITWAKPVGSSLVWKHEKDILILSLVPDQFGKPEYHITIFYRENLEQLIRVEEKERRKTLEGRKNAVNEAF